MQPNVEPFLRDKECFFKDILDAGMSAGGPTLYVLTTYTQNIGDKMQVTTVATLPPIVRGGNGNVKYAEENAKIRELLNVPGAHAISERAGDKNLAQRIRIAAQKLGVTVAIRNLDGDLWFSNKDLVVDETTDSDVEDRDTTLEG